MSTVAQQIIDELKRNGVKFYVTVPDSLTRPLWQIARDDAELDFVRVCHEAEAVAVAAGLHIAGAKCVVVMENSGFFQAIEAVRALPIDMQIPVVMLVSYVGRLKPGQNKEDAMQEILAAKGGAGTHIIWQGAISEPLLDTLGIAHATFEGAQSIELVSWAFERAEKERQPVVLLLNRLEEPE
ncbi:MAG: hypothetical protein HYX92_15950 [Chloroflexi bacterium]|nr:hypothetical protein [Chloroflexota bacterium]